MSSQANTVPNDPELAKLIARVESNNDFRAMRFEPATFQMISNRPVTSALTKIIENNHVSLATARVIYSTSWGAFQIMGFNLYSLGFEGHIIDFANLPSLQLVAFNWFLDANHINWKLSDIMADDNKLRMFAVAYNGSDAYAARMKQFYKS